MRWTRRRSRRIIPIPRAWTTLRSQAYACISQEAVEAHAPRTLQSPAGSVIPLSLEARMNRRLLVAGFSCVCFLTTLAGCRREEALATAPELPVVPVSRPVAREVTDYVYYTGRLDAVQSVDVRPRVTGYLTKMPFHEGGEVKKGDLLFEVDPRPYRAQYDAYKAQVELYDAAYRLARAENSRSKAINSEGRRRDQSGGAREEPDPRGTGPGPVESFQGPARPGEAQP